MNPLGPLEIIPNILVHCNFFLWDYDAKPVDCIIPAQQAECLEGG